MPTSEQNAAYVVVAGHTSGNTDAEGILNPMQTPERVTQAVPFGSEDLEVREDAGRCPVDTTKGPLVVNRKEDTL